MSICDIKINNDITSPCNNPLYTGKKQKGWLINRDDVASYTLTGNYVTGITLVTGAQAYFIETHKTRLPTRYCAICRTTVQTFAQT